MDELILGDSIEIVRQLPAESAHAIISDIPYGIGCDDWDVLHSNSNSAYGGASARWTATAPLTDTGVEYVNRNGVYRRFTAQADGTLTLQVRIG